MQYRIILIILILLVLTHILRELHILNNYRVGEKLTKTLLIYSEPTIIGKSLYNIRTIYVYYDGLLRIDFPDVDQVSIGDHIQATGTISTSGINSPDSLYTQKRLIVQRYQVVRRDRYSGLSMVGKIGRFFQKTRGILEQKLRILLIPREADLLAGILFGIHAIESDSLRKQLSASGLMYLVSVSSMKLYTVSIACDRAFKGIFSRRKVGVMILILFFFYFNVVNTTPTMFRLFFLWFLTITARFFGRETHKLWLFTLISLIFLLIRPQLISDLGFLLSTLAILGVQHARLKEKTPFFIRRSSLFRNFLTKMNIGVSIFIYTAPVLLWGIGTLNIVSIFILPLVFWLIPLFMGLGGILIIDGMIGNFLREPLVTLIHVPVAIFLKLSTFLSVLPFGTIKMAPIKRILYGLISFIIVMVSILHDFTPKKRPLIPQKLRY